MKENPKGKGQNMKTRAGNWILTAAMAGLLAVPMGAAGQSRHPNPHGDRGYNRGDARHRPHHREYEGYRSYSCRRPGVYWYVPPPPPPVYWGCPPPPPPVVYCPPPPPPPVFYPCPPALNLVFSF
jgi:hypothetical protein